MLFPCVLAAIVLRQDALPADFREGLAVRGVARTGRIPFPANPVQAAIAAGTWRPPKSGDEVALPAGEKRSWASLSPSADGSFDSSAFSGGYAYFEVRRESPEIAILEASGHGSVYVNGEPRVGDPYGYGFLKLPVALRPGPNSFLFGAGRGLFRARLTRPPARAILNLADPTVPDLIAGRSGEAWAGVVVLNASLKTASDLRIRARLGDGRMITSPVASIPPLSIRKAPVRFAYRAPQDDASAELSLALAGPEGLLDFQKASLRVRTPRQTRKATFLSAIDGSVQYYAVHPAQEDGPGRALILSTHGAGVEAIGQADAYGPKDWAHLVAPTNRRPFGFDWEDWGREDAMEVLEIAQRSLRTDPMKTYLTGHSMGGHGAWYLGLTHPDRFAAVGPSAGWVSFFSYGGAQRPEDSEPISEVFRRTTNPSDTLSLASNARMSKFYVLHGERDDNVPVRESRAMRDALAGVKADFQYHEQPGAGHWWDDDPAPGAACVDWPPMMSLFRESRLSTPSATNVVEFATFHPAISGSYSWMRIEKQARPLELSKVRFERTPGGVKGETVNVVRLALFPSAFDGVSPPFLVDLDGRRLSLSRRPGDGFAAVFVRRDGVWDFAGESRAEERGGVRHLFKQAFRNFAVLVYGTAGTPEENSWSLAKARFDAETFAYRGNGAFRVVSDREAFARGLLRGDNNVVLYGNADSNSAWREAFRGCPIAVRRGIVRIGSRELRGRDLGCLFSFPRSNGSIAAAVCGSGLTGMRLSDRLPYFVSGVQYPDWCVFGPEVLTNGLLGVLAAGFWDDSGRLSASDSAWR